MDAKDLVKRLENLTLDIRVEVLLCELMTNDRLEEGLIRIEPIGLFDRNHQKDLGEIEILRNDFKETDKITFSIWREGLLDALPDGLFYKPTKRQYKKNSKEIREESQRQDVERKAARDFFLPIEQEFYRQRLAVEKIEREAFSAFSDVKGRAFFSEAFWGLNLEGIPEEQITSLLYFLPFSFRYKGDLKMTSAVYSVVLRTKIEMKKHWGIQGKMEDHLIPSLGEAHLGVSSVLGSSFFTGLPLLQLTIGPIPVEDLPKFLPEGPQAKLLEILERFFVSADLEVETTLALSEPHKAFYLDNSDHNGRLAYSTFI